MCRFCHGVGEELFKLMMNKAIIDTHSTATQLRENMTKLDTYMSTVTSNIENFDQYAKVNVDRSKAGVDSTDDLMINLFDSYQVASERNLYATSIQRVISTMIGKISLKTS